MENARENSSAQEHYSTTREEQKMGQDQDGPGRGQEQAGHRATFAEHPPDEGPPPEFQVWRPRGIQERPKEGQGD